MKKILSIIVISLSFMNMLPAQECFQEPDESCDESCSCLDRLFQARSYEWGSVSGGYDDGIFLETDDGCYSLKLNFLTQNRTWYDHRNGHPQLPKRFSLVQSENTRDCLNLSGAVAGLGFYNARFEWGEYVPGTRTDWAYGGLCLGNGFSITLGEMHIPTNREWVINDEFQLAVARSYTTQMLSVINAGSRIGYSADCWRADVYVVGGTHGRFNSEGDITNQRAFNDFGLLGQRSFIVGTRVEWILCGCESSNPCTNLSGLDSAGRLLNDNWADFKEFTNTYCSSLKVLVGGWGSYIKLNGANAPGTPTIKGHAYLFSTDLQAKYGWSSLYALLYTIPHRLRTTAAVVENTIPWGFMLQAGHYLTPKLEGFTRYEYGNYEGAPLINLSFDNYTSIITAGANYYLSGQNIKLSLDAGYSFRALNNPLNFPDMASTDWKIDSTDAWGQVLARLQLQVFF